MTIAMAVVGDVEKSEIEKLYNDFVSTISKWVKKYNF
jgi:hypothetical protein